MAARSRKVQHDQTTRDKIKGSQLVNFLQKHIFEGTDVKKTQITAALGLLRKVLPDLNNIEGTLNNLHHHARELSDEQLATIAAGRGLGASEPAECPQEPDSIH